MLNGFLDIEQIKNGYIVRVNEEKNFFGTKESASIFYRTKLEHYYNECLDRYKDRLDDEKGDQLQKLNNCIEGIVATTDDIPF